MKLKTKAIVLGVIKYKDYDAIVKTYTEQTGFDSFFIKNFFKSGKKKIKKAYFQPANLLDLVITQKNKTSLKFIDEVKIWFHYKNFQADYNKLNQSIFIREILLAILQNEPPDTELFRFVTDSFIQLDQQDFYPDFHLFFLIRLTRFLGFAPSLEKEGAYFDMQNGIFCSQNDFGNILNQSESNLLKQILGTIFASNRPIKINHLERKKLLQIMLDYYQLHVANFRIPKSIKILEEIYQ